MEQIKNNLFNSSFGVKINVVQVIEIINEFIKAKPHHRYKLTVGTDSERRLNNSADFVTAIVIHRVGNGGRYFWRHEKLDKIHNLRNRMYQEVLLSLETGKELIKILKESENPHLDFEIHIDVGENGETKSMIQELVGMVRANNFEARTKPDSYAASKVADRHTSAKK